MRKLFFTFLFGVLVLTLFSQEKNQVIMDTSINQEILFGYCDREAFSNDLFKEWFNIEYESYEIDSVSLSTVDFENNLQPEITIIMGTWCSDSRREVPRFYKILNKLGYDQDNLTLINVNRQKEAGEISLDHLNIKLVPTIIVYENGAEKGRIIESPINSLEKDFAEILIKK